MAVVDALGHLVRFVILPGQAHDLTGVPDMLEGLPLFGALVGDKAFDVGVAARGGRGARGRGGDSLKTEPHGTPAPRPRDVQVAAPDREFLCKDQRVPHGGDKVRQNRRELRSGDSPRRRRGRDDVIVNRP